MKESEEMSTKSRNAGAYSVQKRFVCAVLACAVVLSTFFSGNMSVLAQNAQERQEGSQDSLASNSDADKSGICQEDDGYRFYICGTAVTTPGWTSSDGYEVYVDRDGYVAKVYNLQDNKLELYSGTTITTAANTECVLSDGYNYLFNIDGVKVTDPGWKLAGNSKYYLDQNGQLTEKYTRSGDIIKLYGDSTGSGNWQMYTSTWRNADGMRFYVDKNGTCIKSYSEKLRRMKLLKNGRLVLASNQVVTMNDGMEYYFNAKGIRVKKAGWYSTNNGMNVCTDSQSKVIGKINKSGGVYRFYKLNSNGTQWVIQKNMWKSVGSKLYYFSGNGKAVVVYNSSIKTLYRYSAKSKRYIPVKNEVNRLNGKYYYFYNSKGVRSTSKGWKKASSHTYYYVGSKGYMTSKYVVSGATRKLYDYSYSAKKWVAQKNKWRVVGRQKCYFNSKGIATVQFVTASQKGYVLSKGKWVLVKRSIKRIGGSNFYFDSKGVRVKKAGVYKTANGYLAYVNRKGVVYKREYNLEVKRYYTIDLGNGRSTKVYGYYDLGAAKRLMAEVNAHRNENGLSSLTVSASMTETATTRAKEISNTYGHYRPNGTLCINSMYELFGENLACGFSEEDLVFRAWTKSTAHDRNMLDTSYRTMGAAVFIALDRDKEGFKRYYVLTFGK